MLAIQAVRTGGSEVLEAVDLPLPSPGPGQVLIRHQAVGLNFIDTYHRSGLYPMKMPAVLGLEAAGLVEALGGGVTRFEVGDRVAYNGTLAPMPRPPWYRPIAPSRFRTRSAWKPPPPSCSRA